MSGGRGGRVLVDSDRVIRFDAGIAAATGWTGMAAGEPRLSESPESESDSGTSMMVGGMWAFGLSEGVGGWSGKEMRC